MGTPNAKRRTRDYMRATAYPLVAEGDYCKICDRTIEWDGHSQSPHFAKRIQELEIENDDLRRENAWQQEMIEDYRKMILPELDG